MKKLISRSLDVTDHILNEDLQKLAELVEPLSEEAKAAHVHSLEELNELPETDVALILWHPRQGKFQKFATTSPEVVEINMAFLNSEKDTLPEEVVKMAGANLTCAAYNFGIDIPEGLQKYSSEKFIPNTLDVRTVDQIAYAEKTTIQESLIEKFAWANEQKYPLHNEMAVKKAAAYFEINHTKMPTTKKIEFIKNTVEVANDMEVELGGTALQKFASLQDEFNEDFYNHIKIRQGFIQETDEKSQAMYNDLLEHADEFGAVKTAELLYEVDAKVGLLGRYGHGIEEPMHAVLAMTKIASKTIDGVTVTTEKLANIPDMDLAAVVGNGVVSELRGEDALDILESLPTPIKNGVIKLL